jgi:hypothetical protein
MKRQYGPLVQVPACGALSILLDQDTLPAALPLRQTLPRGKHFPTSDQVGAIIENLSSLFISFVEVPTNIG